MRCCTAVVSLLLLAGCGSAPPKPPAEPAKDGPRVHVGSILNCNQMVRMVRPAYPAEARRRKLRGTVRIRARITRTGEVRDLEVMEGHPLLVPPALAAIRQWRYTPCVIESEPVEPIVSLELTFPPNR